MQYMGQRVRTYGKDSSTVDCKSKYASHITLCREPQKDRGNVHGLLR
jgi:hypothetical protein